MDLQFTVSPDLAPLLEDAAKAQGISPAEFVRLTLESAVAKPAVDDPLFADNAVYRDQGAKDYAANHDDYLYGDAS